MVANDGLCANMTATMKAAELIAISDSGADAGGDAGGRRVNSVFGFSCTYLCGHEAQAAAAGIKHMLGVPAFGSACHQHHNQRRR